MIGILRATIFFLLIGASSALAQNAQYAPENEEALSLLREGKFDEALKIIIPLAEGGDARAQSNLSTIFDRGFGVEPDPEKAHEWAQLAAQQGFVPAMYNLAVMYGQGRGVEQNQQEAVRWLTQAAEQEYAPAMYYLGILYTAGEGVEKDDAAAFSWYSAAARKGVGRAQFQLVEAYAGGIGTEVDAVLSYMWAWISAENGVQPAIDNLQDFANLLPPEVVAEAERRARICLESDYADCG